MKKYIAVILSVIMILSFTACGGNDKPADDTDGNYSAAEAEAGADSGEIPQKYGIISKNRFINKFSGLGEVSDLTEKNGFDACFIKAETVNYIYMFLPDEAMAESLLKDDGEGEAQNEYFNVLETGQNYEFSESISVPDEDGSQQYSVNLRVDNMLIVIAGNKDDRARIGNKAKDAFKSLGYQLNGL